ncbi:MAG TPA: baseplate J/gp47 family protein [Acetobacteraceae bacterium]|nr:baseplate J/gp47 family protein [Acetobacteraceae bacterium]
MSGTASNPANSLPTPVFVTDADGLDPNLILADMITLFQNVTGRTLFPAQVERLLINLYAYREALVRSAIQFTGQQNLLAFASFPVIDYLGQLVGVTRLAGVAATTTLQFTLTGPLTVDVTIPAGTQVGTSDGSFLFATNTALTIPIGSTTGSVLATCTLAGSGGNGFLPGQVNVMVGGNALVASVANTTTSAGGSETETDDHLRARIQAAPNQFSTAGPSGAYRFFTLSADPTIIDAEIASPVPGTVAVFVLTGPITVQPAPAPNSVGIPSQTILNEVVAALNQKTVRPLTDTVQVFAVTEVDYQVTATVTLFADADPTSTEAACQSAATELAINLASSVGNDVVPSQWTGVLSVAGVYDVDLTITATVNGAALTPTADGRFVMQPGQWANCTALNLTFVLGTENEPA